MIIRNGFNINKHNLNNNKDTNHDYLNQEKRGSMKSIERLDERYQKGQIDFDKFKKIAGNYATQHKNLNERLNKKH